MEEAFLHIVIGISVLGPFSVFTRVGVPHIVLSTAGFLCLAKCTCGGSLPCTRLALGYAALKLVDLVCHPKPVIFLLQLSDQAYLTVS